MTPPGQGRPPGRPPAGAPAQFLVRAVAVITGLVLLLIVDVRGVVHPLGDPQGFLGVLSAIGVTDPEALWGDPGAQHAIWAAHDPVALAPRLRGTPLFVSVGDGTAGPFDHGRVQDGGIEASLHPQNVALAERLRRLHIPATIDFYGPGTHSWPYWQRELHRALPLLLRALGGPTWAAAA